MILLNYINICSLDRTKCLTLPNPNSFIVGFKCNTLEGIKILRQGAWHAAVHGVAKRWT